jgi:hypothetical protein
MKTRIILNNYNEIIEAVDNGLKVYSENFGYEVIKNQTGYFIKCGSHMIGLIGKNKNQLNGSNFFYLK